MKVKVEGCYYYNDEENFIKENCKKIFVDYENFVGKEKKKVIYDDTLNMNLVVNYYRFIEDDFDFMNIYYENLIFYILNV